MKNTITKLLLTLAILLTPSFALKAEASYEYNGAVYDDESMDGLRYIKDTSITTFTVPSTVRSVSRNAFSGCSNLSSITINNKIDFAGSLGTGLVSLKELVLPIGCGGSPVTGTYIEKVVIVGNGSADHGYYNLSFDNCQYLKEIKFDGSQYITTPSLESSRVVDNAFINNCPNLKSFTIPSNGTMRSYYYKMMFVNQNNMTIYYNSDDINYMNAFGARRFPHDEATCSNITYIDISTRGITASSQGKSATVKVGDKVNVEKLCGVVSNNSNPLSVIYQTSSNTSVISNKGEALKAGTAVLTTTFEAGSKTLVVTTGTITVVVNDTTSGGSTDSGSGGGTGNGGSTDAGSNTPSTPSTPSTPKTYKTSLVKSKATIKKSGKVQIEINDAHGKTTYKTSNKSIATVSSSGKVTGKKIGKATITVKNNGKTMKFKVTVKAAPKLNTKDAVLGTGQTFKIKVSNNDSKNIKYSSSNKRVATIDNEGKITARKKGTTTITTKVDGVTVKIKVKVVKASLSKTKASIKKGSTTTLTIKEMPTSTKIKWSSSNKKVASVTKKGTVKGLKKGTATIKATCNGKTYTCKITVK